MSECFGKLCGREIPHRWSQHTCAVATQEQLESMNHSEIDRLSKENERYLKALKEIADYHYLGHMMEGEMAQEIAKEALKETPQK